MSERIARANTYELVAERLLGEIAEHRLSPGDFVATERELTKRYGVGRSSVREGLRMLESAGVIRQGKATGQFVVGEFSQALSRPLELLVTLGMADLRDIGAMRRLVECETARLAAERRTPEALEQMRATLAEMDRQLGMSQEGALHADLGFHVLIAEASGNRAMEAVVGGLRDTLIRDLHDRYLVSEDALAQHRRILAAIEAADATGAAAAMACHMNWIDSITPEEESRSNPADSPKAGQGP